MAIYCHKATPSLTQMPSKVRCCPRRTLSNSSGGTHGPRCSDNEPSRANTGTDGAVEGGSLLAAGENENRRTAVGKNENGRTLHPCRGTTSVSSARLANAAPAEVIEAAANEASQRPDDAVVAVVGANHTSVTVQVITAPPRRSARAAVAANGPAVRGMPRLCGPHKDNNEEEEDIAAPDVAAAAPDAEGN